MAPRTRRRDIYDPNDLKSLQDYTLERLFRRLPRVADVTSYGGTVKRYEIDPDPARMQRYGITLQQLKDAIASNNSNIGGDYIIQGGAAHVVRSLGLLGMGEDPIETAMGMKNPLAAARLPAGRGSRDASARSARSCSPPPTTSPCASTTWSLADRCGPVRRWPSRAW